MEIQPNFWKILLNNTKSKDLSKWYTALIEIYNVNTICNQHPNIL